MTTKGLRRGPSPERLTADVPGLPGIGKQRQRDARTGRHSRSSSRRSMRPATSLSSSDALRSRASPPAGSWPRCCSSTTATTTRPRSSRRSQPPRRCRSACFTETYVTVPADCQARYCTVSALPAPPGRWSWTPTCSTHQRPCRSLFAAAGGGRTGDGPDLIVASRYLNGGTAEGLAGWKRRCVSSVSTRIVALLFPRRLSGVSDAMTGFFAVRRSVLDPARLHPSGFKILFEILASHPLRVTEVPFEFAERRSGQSKASLRQGLLFAAQLLRLRGKHAPLRRRAWSIPRAARFSVLGAANVVLDVAVFNALLAVSGRPLTSKLVASAAAITSSWWVRRHGPGLTVPPAMAGGRWQFSPPSRRQALGSPSCASSPAITACT